MSDTEDGEPSTSEKMKLNPNLDSIRYVLQGYMVPCPVCTKPRMVEVLAEELKSSHPRLQECQQCGNREEQPSTNKGNRNGNHDITDHVSYVNTSGNAGEATTTMKREEEVYLSVEDTVPSSLLDGPSWCPHCECDPCQFFQLETNILDFDNRRGKVTERNSWRRKRAYQYVTRHREGVLGNGVRRELPACILAGVRSLFPPVDGAVMGFKEA